MRMISASSSKTKIFHIVRKSSFLAKLNSKKIEILHKSRLIEESKRKLSSFPESQNFIVFPEKRSFQT